MSGKKTVCVDLDGVLASYSGWKGVEVIGDPIPGAVQFTRDLSAFAYVLVFTTRCKGDFGRADDPERLKGIVKAWLDRHGFAYHDIYTGQGKPPAAAYIDDRAVCCRPESPWVSAEETTVTVARADVYREAVNTARNFCDGEKS